MTAIRARPPTVGSAEWILAERELAQDFVSQEVEEFGFSVQNDMEWLNEHMAEIFNGEKINVAEVFKTPGKLRGKTPRTARKLDGAQGRLPLTDVFAPTYQFGPMQLQKSPYSKKPTQIQIAEDDDQLEPPDLIQSARLSFGIGKENNDSGYHDMDDDVLRNSPKRAIEERRIAHFLPEKQLQQEKSISPAHVIDNSTERETTSETFISATEEPAKPSEDHVSETDKEIRDETTVEQAVTESLPTTHFSSPRSTHYSISTSIAAGLRDAVEQVERETPARQVREDSASSEASSTQRPVLRKKSSLTFASLPAREPIATKKSMGPRTSQLERAKPNLPVPETNQHQSSALISRLDKVQTDSMQKESDEPEKDFIETGPKDATLEDKTSERPTTSQSKTSTQRLQERLALLGQPPKARNSKSTTWRDTIPSNNNGSQNITTPSEEPNTGKEQLDELDESWIGPIAGSATSKANEAHANTILDAAKSCKPVPLYQPPASQGSTDVGISNGDMPAYPVLPKSSARTLRLIPQTGQQTISIEANQPVEVEPPALSPVASKHEGPLSASKAKLFSVLKSAKGIFASSASASAQAKMNVSPPRPMTAMSQYKEELGARANERGTGQSAAVSVLDLCNPSQAFPLPPPPRRASARLKAVSVNKDFPNQDRDEEQRDQREHLMDNAQMAEAVGQAKSMPKSFDLAQENEEYASHDSADSSPPPPPPKEDGYQAQRLGDARRPARVLKETAPKSRPAPVSIKLRGFPTQAIGGFNNPARPATTPLQTNETVVVSNAARAPTLSKQASNSSLNTISSSQSFKTTATSVTRPKALDAAARKRENVGLAFRNSSNNANGKKDEREAQRKAEQKREVERRRAAKADEERRALEEARAAAKKANEAKQQVQKQAAEQRKLDAIRQNEQRRVQAMASQKQAKVETTIASQSDRTRSVHQQGFEAPPPRPVSRLANNHDYSRPPVPHINPSKPPKRQMDIDDAEEPSQQGQFWKASQNEQNSVKRRKTSEDSFAEVISRPTMAPPLRPSMMKKESNTRLLSAMPSQSSSSQHNPSMMKSVVNTQHHTQHPALYPPKTPHMNDLAKFSNAKIAFAEPSSSHHPSMYSQQRSQQQHLFKTPGTAETHKSSPQYPNGDSIELPEIATDSEDSDDDSFEPPEWANSPALRELLAKQQLVDPMKVFGPIAPLMMDEVFKGNKERQAKFRKRTSSANWNGPDRLTEEERRKDRLARERLEKEGAWTYGTPS